MPARGVPAVTSRAELLGLLAEACELEHGLACCYLYAAFSLKQDLSEGGLTWQQLQRVRLWAAQLYFVASQEMLHLAQAWNLLAAAGGSPRRQRPMFPQSSRYYPLHLPLTAERFSLATLDRFIAFERPTALAPPLSGNPDGAGAFHTVGELYALIRSGFESVPGVVVARPETQIGPRAVDFPDLVAVVDVASAVEAIGRITSEGEGTATDRVDCHYGVFRSLRDDYLRVSADALGSNLTFNPVRSAIDNPVTPRASAQRREGANVLSDRSAIAVADLFDAVYQLMLGLLVWVFDSATEDSAARRLFSRQALNSMTSVLKPLGEALMRTPAGAEYEADTAGPPFSLGAELDLPLDRPAVLTVVRERIGELAREARRMALQHPDLGGLSAAADTLDGVLAAVRETSIEEAEKKRD